MEKFRQISVVRRVAVSVIALYALLLQGFLVAPAAAYNSLGEIICQQDGSQSEKPAGEHHSHHGLCCILACAVCGAAFVAVAAGMVFFPPRAISRFAFAPPPVAATRTPAQFHLAARGPPQAL